MKPQPSAIIAARMQVLPLSRPAILDFIYEKYPARITIPENNLSVFSADATHFIVVHSGEFCAVVNGCAHTLAAGYFGSFPGELQLKGRGLALIMSAIGYKGMVLSGGPIEPHGRLRYIDGCTSSLLIAPPVKGEPCLNFLHLPRHTSQTMHTHPTLRAGLILSGSGRCETTHGMLDFSAGTAFVIPPGVAHSFQSQQENMRIVIYHPDSDSGPTHKEHTMLNRTFVNGQSARAMTDLHTRDEVQ